MWDVTCLLKSVGSPAVGYVVREKEQFGGRSRVRGPVSVLILLEPPASGPPGPLVLGRATFVDTGSVSQEL